MDQLILTRHLKLHEKRDGQQLTEVELSQFPYEPSYLRQYNCSVCDKYFLTQEILNVHFTAHTQRIYPAESAASVDNSEDVSQLPDNRIHIKAGVIIALGLILNQQLKQKHLTIEFQLNKTNGNYSYTSKNNKMFMVQEKVSR